MVVITASGWFITGINKADVVKDDIIDDDDKEPTETNCNLPDQPHLHQHGAGQGAQPGHQHRVHVHRPHRGLPQHHQEGQEPDWEQLGWGELQQVCKLPKLLRCGIKIKMMMQWLLFACRIRLGRAVLGELFSVEDHEDLLGSWKCVQPLP